MIIPEFKVNLKEFKPIIPTNHITINSKPMHTLLINNIEVLFPYEPYPSQLLYMEKLMQALCNKSNAILESPTGTGKTLCLLCTTIAYVIHLQKQNTMKGLKIVYATRTHSQISQVIKELKKTAYEPFTVIMGGRSKLCMNEHAAETREEIDVKCQTLLKMKECRYYKRPTNRDKKVYSSIAEILDIEELCEYAERNTICPYYYSKEKANESELLLMPYNYMLQRKIRSRLELDVVNAVIIFDEAHNLPETCEEMESCEIYVHELNLCLEEIKYITRLLHRKSKKKKIDNQLQLMLKELSDQALAMLEDPINAFISFLSKCNIDNKKGIRIFGEDVFTYFNNAINPKLSTNDKKASFDINLWYMGYSDYLAKASNIVIYKKHRSMLYKWKDILDTVYCSIYSNKGMINQRYATTSVDYGIMIFDDYSYRKTNDNTYKRKFCLTCFNAAVTFHKFLEHSPMKSIILTSGTLSPLDIFEKELDTKFPYKLENSHTIKDDQVLASILTTGNNGAAINLNFQNRSKLEMINSVLGSLQIAIDGVKGGILIFCSSYDMVDVYYNPLCKQFRLNNSATKVFKESKFADENDIVINSYLHNIKENGQSILLAVCRGKISEGYDFSDDAARLAICIGIPFSNYTDSHIEMKMHFLSKIKTIINPQYWYTMNAIRALNQSIGRVIRHAYDYGALLLIDERITQYKKMLSKWVRDRIITFKSPCKLKEELNLFYEKCTTNKVLMENKKLLYIKEKKNMFGEKRKMQSTPEINFDSDSDSILNDFEGGNLVGNESIDGYIAKTKVVQESNDNKKQIEVASEHNNASNGTEAMETQVESMIEKLKMSLYSTIPGAQTEEGNRIIRQVILKQFEGDNKKSANKKSEQSS